MLHLITHKELDEYPDGTILVGENEVPDLPDNVTSTRKYYPRVSRINPWYGEVEAFKYIQQFDKDKYKGQMTYRRWLKTTVVPDGFDGVAVPIKVYPNLFTQYCSCHIARDIEIGKQITIQLYPDYQRSWNDIIDQGNTLYYGGGFILKGDIYDRYVDWLLKILDAMRSYYNFNDMRDIRKYVEDHTNNNQDYQARFGGFIAERLTTLFFIRNLKIYDTEYDLKGGLTL